jgi:hypothetical protein
LVTDVTGDGGRVTGGTFTRHLNQWRGYPEGMPMLAVLVLALMLVTPSRGFSQSQKTTQKAQEKDAPVPKAYLPPPGMCRVWVDNVPAARQPAPTDCATAIRNRPPNARVVFPAGKGNVGEPKALVPSRPKADTTKKKPPRGSTERA